MKWPQVRLRVQLLRVDLSLTGPEEPEAEPPARHIGFTCTHVAPMEGEVEA